MHNRLRRTPVFAGLLMLVTAAPVQAQRIVTAQLGVGSALEKRNDALGGTHRHIGAAVEVSPPLLPIGVRGDAMWINDGASSGIVAVSLNAVFALKLPVIRPYALAGWGQYGVGGSAPRSGANAGVGIRLSAGRLGLFGEYRRHWPLSRSLMTAGITL